MRARVVKMIATAVTVAVLILGIPAMLLGGVLVWQWQSAQLDIEAQNMANLVERRINDNAEISEDYLERWISPTGAPIAKSIRVATPDEPTIVIGQTPSTPVLTSVVVTPSGATVRIEQSAWTAITKVTLLVAALLTGMGASLIVGLWLAQRGSRQISAPLIYLAAQAEQIGSGQVRASVKPSGIEEIDLVQAELVRTGERMAGRLAAERQFAANASHQLRTPLTALSMRLEEIELLAAAKVNANSAAQIEQETRVCMEQIERLTRVIDDLLSASKQSDMPKEAVHILEVFNQQREEWEESFSSAGRELIFTDEAAQPVLTSSSVLAQILATLIENSLRYGSGTTKVMSRPGQSSRGVIITVEDEGEGVSDELADLIFDTGVSGHGSSGIGLPLAKDLAQSVGARLELTQARPAVFTISLAALPASLDPDIVMPKGAVVSVGRRRRRF